MADCTELLRRYADDRSEAAFADLVRQQIDGVFAFALRRLNGDRALAEEVTQSVFTDLARKARLVAQRPTVVGWLYRSTQFAAASAVRSEQRRRQRENEAQLLQELPGPTGAASDWSSLRPLLDRAMSRLSDAERDALILRFFEGQTFAIVGQRLGLRENAARMRVERALEKVRAALARRGVTSSAAALAGIFSAPSAGAAPAGLAARVAGQAFAQVATVGPAVSWLPLMSTTKLALGTAGILGIAAILCLPSLGVALQVRSVVRREQRAWVQADEAYRADEARVRRLESRAAEAERQQAELRRHLGRGTPAAGGGMTGRTATPTPGAAAGNAKAEGQKFLAAFPQARPLLSEMARGQFEGNYAPFLHSAGLAPNQVEQLERAVAESWIANLAVTPGNITNLPGVEEVPPDQLRQILGDTAYQQLEDYEREMQAHVMAGNIATAVAYTAEPLTAGQADELAQIVAANSPDYRNGQKLDPTAVDWAGVQAQAQKIFSSAQWPAAAGVLAGLQFRQVAAQAAAGTP